MKKQAWACNKTDEGGNVITGYQEILRGTRQEVEFDYRFYHEYEGPVSIEERHECAACAMTGEETPATTTREVAPGCYGFSFGGTAPMCDECAKMHDEHEEE